MKTNTNNKIHCINKTLSENKSLEIQWGRFDNSDCLFDFQLEWSLRGDHAGLNWHNEILGFHLIIKIYDHRHWDYEKKAWFV